MEERQQRWAARRERRKKLNARTWPGPRGQMVDSQPPLVAADTWSAPSFLTSPSFIHSSGLTQDEQRQLELFSALEEEELAMDMDDIGDDEDAVSLALGGKRACRGCLFSPPLFSPHAVLFLVQAARDAQQRLLTLYEPAELAEGFRSDFDEHIRETGEASLNQPAAIRVVPRGAPRPDPGRLSFQTCNPLLPACRARPTRAGAASLRHAAAARP